MKNFIINIMALIIIGPIMVHETIKDFMYEHIGRKIDMAKYRKDAFDKYCTEEINEDFDDYFE